MTIHKDSSAAAVVQWCQAKNLPAELVGRWVWVFFTSKPDAQTRDSLKESGFRFSRAHDGRPDGWYHTGGHNRGRRRPVKGCDARTIHGSVPVSELVIS